MPSSLVRPDMDDTKLAEEVVIGTRSSCLRRTVVSAFDFYIYWLSSASDADAWLTTASF